MKNVPTTIEAAQAAGSVRLFSVRHELPAEWANCQGQTPGANQRFELALDLREKHYPFWTSLRLLYESLVNLVACKAPFALLHKRA